MTRAFTQAELKRFAPAFIILEAGPNLSEDHQQVLAYIATTQDFENNLAKQDNMKTYPQLDNGKVLKCLRLIKQIAAKKDDE